MAVGEEFFMQLKGELVLKVIEAGTFKDVSANAHILCGRV